MTNKRKHLINVQPLRSSEEIDEMIFAVRRRDKGTPKRKDLADRDVLLLLLGINMGLRVNDRQRLFLYFRGKERENTKSSYKHDP